jgi:outer membrane lipoprotein-sorting protein
MIRFLAFFIILLTSLSLRAQTASELTSEIEKTYLSGEAVKATFDLAGEKKITLVASLISTKYFYETSGEKVVNDGATVSNLNKKLKQVTINEVKANKQNGSIGTQDFFRFSSNYTSSLLSSKKNSYSLELTPKESLKKLYEQAGVSSLVVDLVRDSKKKTVTIKSILANSKGIKQKAGNVKITSIQKTPADMFTFPMPKGVKVVDLRD